MTSLVSNFNYNELTVRQKNYNYNVYQENLPSLITNEGFEYATRSATYAQPKENNFSFKFVNRYVNKFIENKRLVSRGNYRITLLLEDINGNEEFVSSRYFNLNQDFDYRNMFLNHDSLDFPFEFYKVKEIIINLILANDNGARNDCLYECLKSHINVSLDDFNSKLEDYFVFENDKKFYPASRLDKVEQIFRIKIRLFDDKNEVIYPKMDNQEEKIEFYLFNRHYTDEIKEEYYKSFNFGEFHYLEENKVMKRNHSYNKDKNPNKPILFNFYDETTELYHCSILNYKYGYFKASPDIKEYVGNDENGKEIWKPQFYYWQDKKVFINKPYNENVLKVDHNFIKSTKQKLIKEKFKGDINEEIMRRAYDSYNYISDEMVKIGRDDLNPKSRSIKHLILNLLTQSVAKNELISKEGKLPIDNEDFLLTKCNKSSIIYHKNGKYKECPQLDFCSFFPSIECSSEEFPISRGKDESQSKYINAKELPLGIFVAKIDISEMKCKEFADYTERYNVYLSPELNYLKSIGAKIILDETKDCHIYNCKKMKMVDFCGDIIKPLFELKKKYKGNDKMWLPKELLVRFHACLYEKALLTKFEVDEFKLNEINENTKIKMKCVIPKSNEKEFKYRDYINEKGEEIRKFIRVVEYKYHPSSFRNPWCRVPFFVMAHARIKILKTIIENNLENKVVRIYTDSFIIKDGMTEELKQRYIKENPLIDNKRVFCNELGCLKLEEYYKNLEIVKDKSGKRLLYKEEDLLGSNFTIA